MEIIEKTLEDMLIAGYRLIGKYSDIGIGFKKLGKAYRYASGKPMALYYDEGHKEIQFIVET